MKEVNRNEYAKEGPYEDLAKFENHVWYGLCKILTEDFCKTGYFRTRDSETKLTYWQMIQKGKFYHEINGVIIDVDRTKGIFIRRVEAKKGEEVKQTTLNIKEIGEGDEADVFYFGKGRQLGYLSTSRTKDETLEYAKELAKTNDIELLSIKIMKRWRPAR